MAIVLVLVLHGHCACHLHSPVILAFFVFLGKFLFRNKLHHGHNDRVFFLLFQVF